MTGIYLAGPLFIVACMDGPDPDSGTAYFRSERELPNSMRSRLSTYEKL
jgi:nucleoside 2-deoxyribosyltransferase